MRDLKHLILLFGWTLIAAIPIYGVLTHAGHPITHAYLATMALAVAFVWPYAALLHAKRTAEAAVAKMTSPVGWLGPVA